MLIIDTIVYGTHPFPSLSELLFPIFKNCTIWWSALFWPAFNGPTKSVKSKFSRKGLYKIYDAWSECHSLQISGLSPALDTGHTQLNVHISFTEPSLFPKTGKIKFERFRQNHHTWTKLGKERILSDCQKTQIINIDLTNICNWLCKILNKDSVRNVGGFLVSSFPMT